MTLAFADLVTLVADVPLAGEDHLRLGGCRQLCRARATTCVRRLALPSHLWTLHRRLAGPLWQVLRAGGQASTAGPEDLHQALGPICLVSPRASCLSPPLHGAHLLWN